MWWWLFILIVKNKYTKITVLKIRGKTIKPPNSISEKSEKQTLKTYCIFKNFDFYCLILRYIDRFSQKFVGEYNLKQKYNKLKVIKTKISKKGVIVFDSSIMLNNVVLLLGPYAPIVYPILLADQRNFKTKYLQNGEENWTKK